ncbi:hypothetical protein [Levilactobacillus acidifarinae]|uniref:hypothetical protein n=1 Tax=Levilactobacillus acidifarinae TaxID=267364 RepID=UPI000A428AC9|nr:hypothetical protein [Levilactobacillus acidifarinae]
MRNKRVTPYILFIIMIFIAYIVLMRSGNSSLAATITNILYDKKVQILTLVFLALLLGSLIVLTRRFWIGSATFLIIVSITSIANYEKVTYRNEGILPSDLLMASSLNKILTMLNPVFIIVSVVILGLMSLGHKSLNSSN